MWFYAPTDVLASALKCGDHQGGSLERLVGSLNEMPEGKIRVRDFGRRIDAQAR